MNIFPNYLNTFEVGSPHFNMTAVSRFTKAQVSAMGPFAVYSGGFDPVHEGHLACIAAAAKMFGSVVIIANNDGFLRQKRQGNLALAAPLIPLKTRLTQLASLAGVAAVVEGVDHDQTVVRSLQALISDQSLELRWFVNGGDRTRGTVPEEDICEKNSISMEWSIGGDVKLAESSVIVTRAAAIAALRAKDVTPTRWGSFCTLQETPGEKQKVLQFDPGCGVSIQTHRHRSEWWRCVEGSGVLLLGKLDHAKQQVYDNKGVPEFGYRVPLVPGVKVQVLLGQAHAAVNTSDEDQLLVHETQLGDRLIEEDITRFGDPFNNPDDADRRLDWIRGGEVVPLRA